MERWDVFDKNRIPTGRTMVRGAPYPEDGWHLVVHICLFNAAGEMLIQRRQDFKEGWSGMWDVTTGGSAVAGESSGVAAGRELFEEVGYAADLSNCHPALSLYGPHIFDDWYILRGEAVPSAMRLQAEEVAEVRWASVEEILAMIDAGVFIPYKDSLIRFLFDLSKGSGGMRI